MGNPWSCRVTPNSPQPGAAPTGPGRRWPESDSCGSGTRGHMGGHYPAPQAERGSEWPARLDPALPCSGHLGHTVWEDWAQDSLCPSGSLWSQRSGMLSDSQILSPVMLSLYPPHLPVDAPRCWAISHWPLLCHPETDAALLPSPRPTLRLDRDPASLLPSQVEAPEHDGAGLDQATLVCPETLGGSLSPSQLGTAFCKRGGEGTSHLIGSFWRYVCQAPHPRL